MSRWEELMKQPKAKIVTVHNQLDEYDPNGKKFLISDRVTPNFDAFVNDVNDKLAPPGIALRKIYTAQHGHPVRSVSALTVSKEYTASPKKFDKTLAERQSRLSKKSKKHSIASSKSDGYKSDGGVNANSKQMAKNRMSLMERQNLYARSHSPNRTRSRSVSPAKSPAKAPPPKPKPKPTFKKKSAPVKKQPSKRNSFNAAGKKRLDQKFADTEDYDDDRVPTPPGKRRVAFRGQYIFVTDDDEEYSEDDGKSKASTAKSRRSVNKSPSKYSARSRISEEDEDYYDDDYSNDSNSQSKKTISKSTKSGRSNLGNSNNHLSPNRKFSSKSNKSIKSSTSNKSSKSSKSSRQSTADSGRNTGSDNSDDSDEDYGKSNASKSPSSISKKSRLSTKSKNSNISSRSKSAANSDGSDESEDESDDGRASRISKYSKYSKLSKQNSKNNDSDDEYYDDDSLKSSRISKSAKSGGSAKSNASSVYQASRKNSNAKSVADSKDTKVNTPVDLRAASEVSDNGSEDYYSDEYSYDDSNGKSKNSQKKL